MPRSRTISQAYEFLKSTDDETAVTEHACGSLSFRADSQRAHGEEVPARSGRVVSLILPIADAGSFA